MGIPIAGVAESGTCEFRLEAARLFGPPPINDVYLPLSTGVTALYGLNGAGKTRILRALSALFRAESHAEGYLVASSDLRAVGAEAGGLAAGLAEIAHELDVDPVWIDEAMGVVPDHEVDEIDAIGHDWGYKVDNLVTAMIWMSFAYEDGAPAEPPAQWARDVAAKVADQGLWILRPSREAGSGCWDVSPAWLLSDHDVEFRRRASELSSQARVGDGATLMDLGRNLVRDFPVLRMSALAWALAIEDKDAISAAIEDLREASWRPVELIAPGFNLTCCPVQLDVGDLLDADLPSSEALSKRALACLTARAESGFDGSDPPLEAAATSIANTATAIIRRALPSALTIDFVLHSGPEGQPSFDWTCDDGFARGLSLEELSGAQHRWAARAIVVALRAAERDLEQERKRIHRLQAESARLEAQSGQLQSLRSDPEELAEAAALANERVIAYAEEEMEETRSRREWKIARGFEPDFDEAEYDVEELLESEEPADYVDPYLEHRIARISSIDPKALTSKYLSRYPPIPLILAIDEPEGGLHRSAERDMVDQLVQIGEANSCVFVATHSPEFLRNPSVHPVLVKRDPSGAASLHVDLLDLKVEDAEKLGLDRLGMLSLYRTIILVEGRHDELVLEELLREELVRRRALVVPLHGGRLLPHAADARFMQDFTDHRIVAMVDNLEPQPFASLLDVARQLQPGDTDEFDRRADEVLGSFKADEVGFIRRLLRRAFEHGRLERYGVHGLTKPDILEYLPTGSFGLTETWDALRTAYDAQTTTRPFKRWILQKKDGASFDDDRVRTACRQLDEIPPDLTALLNLLDEPVRRNGRAKR